MYTEHDSEIFGDDDLRRSQRAIDSLKALNESSEILDHIFSGNGRVPFHSDVTSNLDEISKVLKGQPSTGARGTTRSTYIAPAQPIAEADFSDDLLKVEDSQPSQPSPHLARVVDMVATLRRSEPFRKYKDRPPVLAASTELVQSMLRYVEQQAGA